MVAVPPGDANDPTRLPSFYDSTSNFLTKAGLPMLV